MLLRGDPLASEVESKIVNMIFEDVAVICRVLFTCQFAGHHVLASAQTPNPFARISAGFRHPHVAQPKVLAFNAAIAACSRSTQWRQASKGRKRGRDLPDNY